MKKTEQGKSMTSVSTSQNNLAVSIKLKGNEGLTQAMQDALKSEESCSQLSSRIIFRGRPSLSTQV
jgi:hypothetical protein